MLNIQLSASAALPHLYYIMFALIGTKSSFKFLGIESGEQLEDKWQLHHHLKSTGVNEGNYTQYLFMWRREEGDWINQVAYYLRQVRDVISRI